MMRYQMIAKKSHEAKKDTAKLKKVQDQSNSSVEVKKSFISLCLSCSSSVLVYVLILPCFEINLPFLVCACMTAIIPEVLRNGFHLRLLEDLEGAMPKKVPPAGLVFRLPNPPVPLPFVPPPGSPEDSMSPL